MLDTYSQIEKKSKLTEKLIESPLRSVLMYISRSIKKDTSKL